MLSDADFSMYYTNQTDFILSTIYSINQPIKEQFRFFFRVALPKQIVNIKHI